MSKVVLFDMDGTLTPPREKMNSNILKPLSELQKNGFEIAIVSGSDLDYIKEQCELLWDINNVDPYKIHFLPCNGTKYFLSNSSGFEKKYDLNMKDTVGEYTYNNVIRILLDCQSSIRYLVGEDIPLSGTFVQYRGSMINWCPIGRDASTEERKIWVHLDEKYKIRETMLKRLMSYPVFHSLQVKLGGETSFDIYPNGWDKTYAWNVFEDYKEIYFVGDRCFPKGNDYEAYIRAGNNGFNTAGPDETISIISEILSR